MKLCIDQHVSAKSCFFSIRTSLSQWQAHCTHHFFTASTKLATSATFVHAPLSSVLAAAVRASVTASSIIVANLISIFMWYYSSLSELKTITKTRQL
jgi:hypothetical protein